MENIIFSLNIVLPVFLVGALGYYLKKWKVISDNFVMEATSLCFEVLLPTMLFRSVYTANFEKAADPVFFWFCFLGNCAVVGAAFLITPLFVKEKYKIGTIIQAVFRSNIMLIGFSVLLNTYGARGTDYVAVLIAPVISLYNVAAVAAFAVFDSSCKKGELTFKNVSIKILKNHYIIALILAVSFVLLKIKIPEIPMRVINYVADIATPLALLMLGGQFSFRSAKNNLKFSIPTCIVRLVLIPFIFVSGGIMLGFRDSALMTVLVLFGSATAVSCAAMAFKSGGDYELAGEITLLSTFMSVFTVFSFIYGLKCFNFI